MVKRIVRVAKSVIPTPVYRRCCKAYDRIRPFGLFFAYQGCGRQCPFCNFRFRRFAADGGPESPLFQREHIIGGPAFAEANCPFCYSFERERHAYLYLRDMTDVFERPVRLLHVAPERHLQKVMSACKNIEYLTADLSSPRAQIKMDLTAIQFPPASFDVIICNHVLEHIPNDRSAMREMLRVLRPGGWAMLQVPIAASRAETDEDLTVVAAADRLQRYGQEDHVRVYGRDYPARLRSEGFEVSLFSIRAKFGEAYARRFALLPDEQIFIARRPIGAEQTGSQAS